MNEERAKQLLRRVREGEDRPGKTKYSIDELNAKIGCWNAFRLLRSWSPKAKGKGAFFEVKQESGKKYLDLVTDVERKLINMEDFGTSINLRIAWKRMRLEKPRIEARLKRHSWYLTILGILLGLVLTYLIYKFF